MREDIRKLLLLADKPARYTGGEWNTPALKPEAPLQYLLCFPDVYEVAMSNLGIRILYDVLNARQDTSCENCFAPWPDMGNLLRTHNIPLFSLETQRPMKSFGLIGFSLQYEMCYTNILYMLDLGGIPFRKEDRGEDEPILMAGGPCVVNPAPLEPFIDFFSIGDGEEALDAVAAAFVENKRRGGSKQDFLQAVSHIEGIYVPNISRTPVKRAVIPSLDTAVCPVKGKIGNLEAVHNRSVLEIMRGCTRGCRFCQAGFIYRPVRERRPETALRCIEAMIDNQGYDEVSLSSLSTCDYSELRGLLHDLKPLCDKRHVSISLPSTRVDSFEAEYVADSRKSSLTFAPEAGTQRLRDVINKNVTEEDILRSCRYAFERGYSSVKLYFMLGLPTETMEDVAGIPVLTEKIREVYKQSGTKGKSLNLGVSTATFVPKPFTPFQWERQFSREEITERQMYLRDALRKQRVKYAYHDMDTSQLEAAFARGDSRLGDVLETAYRQGCVFDGWTEMLHAENWKQAFAACDISVEQYTREFGEDETLPWDVIDIGVTKAYFLRERALSRQGMTTSDCRGDCKQCGIMQAYPEAFRSACAQMKPLKKP